MILKIKNNLQSTSWGFVFFVIVSALVFLFISQRTQWFTQGAQSDIITNYSFG